MKKNIHVARFGRGWIMTGIWVLGFLAFLGCAQFQHKMPEVLPFMDRTQTKTEGQVRVTVAVPSAEESKEIFGFPLAAKNIQPVWLEVENKSDHRICLYQPEDGNQGGVGEAVCREKG